MKCSAPARLAVDALRDGIPPESPQTVLAYVVLTVADATLGDIELAYQEIQEGLTQTYAAFEGDSFAAAALEGVAAIWATLSGDYVTGRAHVEKSLSAARNVGNPTVLSVAHYGAGDAIVLEDPSAALAHYDETIALVRAGAANTVYGPALAVSAVMHVRSGNYTEALERSTRGGCARDHDADMSFLIGAVAGAIVILDTVGWSQLIPELAGIVSLGKYSHLYVNNMANRYRTPEVIDRLRAEIGEAAFDRAAERGAAMDADEIAAFVLANIDRAMLDTPDA